MASAHLQVQQGPHKGQQFQLDRLGSYSIGRRSANDIKVAEKAVSRRHCRIDFDGEFYWLVDLDSHNGTFVNGRRISRCLLYDGDMLKVGHAEMVFVMPQDDDTG
jgi:pSer/pThr/pTyr-binding forkhead associated (FHA) protein